jgi:hypothetical protein
MRRIASAFTALVLAGCSVEAIDDAGVDARRRRDAFSDDVGGGPDAALDASLDALATDTRSGPADAFTGDAPYVPAGGICGDGVVGADESCDTAGDTAGCVACKVQEGYSCIPSAASVAWGTESGASVSDGVPSAWLWRSETPRVGTWAPALRTDEATCLRGYLRRAFPSNEGWIGVDEEGCGTLAAVLTIRFARDFVGEVPAGTVLSVAVDNRLEGVILDGENIPLDPRIPSLESWIPTPVAILPRRPMGMHRLELIVRETGTPGGNNTGIYVNASNPSVCMPL